VPFSKQREHRQLLIGKAPALHGQALLFGAVQAGCCCSRFDLLVSLFGSNLGELPVATLVIARLPESFSPDCKPTSGHPPVEDPQECTALQMAIKSSC
jgi:hypothetical protein